ncbi:transcript variant X1 [Nothobranchius furzeri]|uniref:Transcript variant X1 n=1 Tax=Nothobranchius furzeri TaxID=105023 RepID=A0A8C6LN81_NOTFU|nr:transcript variant X1 [Nothobranchius furzeri]
MASTVLFLLQLLLLSSLVTASHHYGGSMTFTYKGTNPDGSFKVDVRARETYDGCYYYHYWYCYDGNCGYPVTRASNQIDSSTNAPMYNRQWCETENVETWQFPGDKPVQLRSASCCWIATRNNVGNWRFNTLVDLGRRSDTGQPNRSPDIAVLPFIRVPQNCPRAYKLPSFDPDGDRVRCRYGNIPNIECDNCQSISGFQLDEDTCTLHYQYATSHYAAFGFEMVVEDFSQYPVNLFYSDGSRIQKYPLLARRKRQITMTPPISSKTNTVAPTWPWQITSTSTPTTTTTTTTSQWWWWFGAQPTSLTGTTTTRPTTTTTTTSTTIPWWWWWTTTSTPTTTTTPPTTTTTATPTTLPWWWWWNTATPPTTRTTATTTTTPTTIPWWWWWTTTSTPTTTTTPPTTTTTATPTTLPWWWWWTTTSTPTTTTTPPTTTTTATPTTLPWWWWWNTATPPTTRTTATTTTPPTTIPWWWWWTTTSTPTTTTTPPTTTPPTTTTTAPPTTIPWWWGWTTTTPPTTAPPTTIPWWWWWTTTSTLTTTTTAPPTTIPWWWGWTTTTPPTTTIPTTTATSDRSTDPFSKLPLQFSFLVDPPVPSCQEGLYLPKFESPTPANGQHVQAEVTKELEIRVKATATYSSIQNIIMSGPTNITKHRITSDEFVIKWTPVPDDLGDHYPICFAVEASSGSSIYQSEMRCVIVDIRKEQIEAKVTCTESSMKVEVAKSSFFGLREDHLRLSDPSNTICSLRTHSNQSHIVAVIPLNACGTQIEEDDDYLIFKNEITTVDDNVNSLITRKHLVEARFYCQYPKRGNVTLGFSAHRKKVTVWEKGFGTFTYQFEFYPDSQFRTMINPNSYPLEYDVGERIYMELDSSSSINNTEMLVESCRAAPYDNPNYHPTYSIIENGCVVDPTVQVHFSSEGQFKFSMEAFKFIGLHDQVYISCSVIMCEGGNPNTRCSQGCINSTSHSSRRRREAVLQTGKHFVSQGPLRLRRSADVEGGGSGMNLNMNLVFIAGCLLAAVGMICGVLIYRAKRSKVKYQPLPLEES